MPSLYKQLEFSDPSKQIRLLRLRPSPTGTDEYAFSLEVHDFQENSRPSYIAISYTWGLPIPNFPVVVNGLQMRLQFNCWYALWQMRHHGYVSDVNFWIDSLCINQADDAEKGHQVAMMGDIFSSASLVAASLGIGESLGNVRGTLASEDSSKIGKLRDRFDQLPYFDRVWIKQEIVLAKDVTIFYGLERLSWSEFADAVNTIKTRSWDSLSELSYSSPSPPKDRSTYLDSLERNRLERISISTQLCNHRSQVTKTPTFMDLVAKYRTAKASVAVDKIYALLSLLPQNDPVRHNLSVRYGQSTWFPVFRDLIKLLYRYYKDDRMGNKHMALSLIRDTLEICGLDEEVIAFLESQAWVPLNARLFHQESASVTIFIVMVLNNEDSEDSDDDQLRVDTNQAEPLKIVHDLGLFGYHYNHNDQDGGPGMLPELHIPPQLKSLRTLYSFQKPRPNPRAKHSYSSSGSASQEDPFPNPRAVRKEEFLVNSDVRAGDILAYLVWDAGEIDLKDGVHAANLYSKSVEGMLVAKPDDRNNQWAVAHVILRRMNVAHENEDEDCNVPFKDETSRGPTQFLLHSWAVPIRRKLTMLSRQLSRQGFMSSRPVMERGRTFRLRLHYRDALIPLLLNYHPLQALLYVNNVPNSRAINLSSRLEDPKNFMEERLREFSDPDKP